MRRSKSLPWSPSSPTAVSENFTASRRRLRRRRVRARAGAGARRRHARRPNRGDRMVGSCLSAEPHPPDIGLFRQRSGHPALSGHGHKGTKRNAGSGLHRHWGPCPFRGCPTGLARQHGAKHMQSAFSGPRSFSSPSTWPHGLRSEFCPRPLRRRYSRRAGSRATGWRRLRRWIAFPGVGTSLR